MKNVLSLENMRAADLACMRREGIDERQLVARVAEAIAAATSWTPPVAVVCGKGNNGADGLALAAVLHGKGVPVSVFCLDGERSPACRYYYDNLPKEVPLASFGSGCSLAGFATVVDCLVGTGFAGEPRGALAEAIAAINHSGATVVSVDINSGLHADSGMTSLCVHSNLTLAVGGFKPGHFLNMAQDAIGRLVNLEVGITPVLPSYHLVEEADLAGLIPPRKHFANKGDYGYVALAGGSLPYSGAIRLAAMAAAAMRAGAGVVKVALPSSLCPLVVSHVLESTLFPLTERQGAMVFEPDQWAALTCNTRVVAFGMGVGTGEGAAAALSYLLTQYEGRLVVDADGITLLSTLPFSLVQAHRPGLVLTPHVKEFARLVGTDVSTVLHNPIAMAMDYAGRVGAVVLLKGPTTIVTDGREVYLVQAGSPGMATAGSGDVLSGILAATLAYVPKTGALCDLLPATYLAAYINGKAGEAAQRDMGAVGMIASDTVAHIAAVVRKLSGEEE